MNQLTVSVIPYVLHFKRPAGTSRGVYYDHPVWYVSVFDANTGRYGIGECAPLYDLSCDYSADYEARLHHFCKEWEQGTLSWSELQSYPSILFGFETALQHLKSGGFALWASDFSEGKSGIPINGLIWMGDYVAMYQQIEEKLQAGFRCVKLKIGAIDFEEELSLLKRIRRDFTANEIVLRVDANGGFTASEALERLKQLAAWDIHSIEQPIQVKQWDEMARLAAESPLPIALDEELIGVTHTEEKKRLLETIRPPYIILKPTLHGGLSGCNEWIALAEELEIGWWVTSALESNVGLNAIAQWAATYPISIPQGLGTGQLYTNNVEMPLSIQGDELWYNPAGEFFDWNRLK